MLLGAVSPTVTAAILPVSTTTDPSNDKTAVLVLIVEGAADAMELPLRSI